MHEWEIQLKEKKKNPTGRCNLSDDLFGDLEVLTTTEEVARERGKGYEISTLKPYSIPTLG